MEFLKSITAKEARQAIQAFPINLKTETIGIDDAQGRVLAEDIIAGDTIPPFTRSLVDGYAVKAKDVQGAKETSPAFLNLKGEVRIGEEAHHHNFSRRLCLREHRFYGARGKRCRCHAGADAACTRCR